MSNSKPNFNLEVQSLKAVCPLGEVVGAQMIAEGKIPVISCEGGGLSRRNCQIGCSSGRETRTFYAWMSRGNVYSPEICHGRLGKKS